MFTSWQSGNKRQRPDESLFFNKKKRPLSSCWQRDIATESQKHRKSQSLNAAAALMNTVALYKQIDMTIKQANGTINVKDMDAAVSFYQSLGFAVKNRWGNIMPRLRHRELRSAFTRQTMEI